MNANLGIMFVFSGVLTVCAFRKDPSLVLDGAKAGGRLFLDIFPLLVLAFMAAGMISVLLPKDTLTRWLGERSGLRGLLIATAAGTLTPGGPFVQFPIVASLLKAGAGVAPVAAYITAWSLLGVQRFLIFEVPILGWKLSLARLAASVGFPVIIGLLTRLVWLRM